jgi:basic amino acid/polyamine antiporter, APA family
MVTYGGVSAATLRLRSPRLAGVVKPAAFTAPLGPVVPIVALLVIAGVLAGATRAQLVGGAAALVAGAALYALRRAAAPAPPGAAPV